MIMVDEAQAREILIQMAESRLQMQSMAAALEEIRASVKEVVQLDRTIAELTIHYQQQSKEIATQWDKIDTNITAIEAVDAKANEWINKARGAWSTLIIFGTLAQAAVLGSVAYTFTHLRTAEDVLLLLNARVVQIEQAHLEKKP